MNPWEPVTGKAVDGVDLPLADGPLAGRLVRDFRAEDLPSLRHAVQDSVRAAGFTDDALDDLVIAVHELATNAIRHGGGRGRLELRHDGDNLVCDVTDHGPGFSDGIPAAGRPPAPDTPGGRGLWLARHLADTLLITEGPGGVTVSITACLPRALPGGGLITAPLNAVAGTPTVIAQPPADSLDAPVTVTVADDGPATTDALDG